MRDRKTGAEFAVECPKELSEESYYLIRQQLEFRQKCMNQGFDNLLELLDMHWQALQRWRAADKGPDKEPQP